MVVRFNNWGVWSNMDSSVEKGQKAKRGRPETVIDYEEVKRLASRLCDQKLICEILQVALSTAQHDKDFQQAYSLGRSAVKKSLLTKQLELAEKGNYQMLQWLGKNILEQADKVETKNEDRVTIVIGKEDANL